MKAVVTDTFIAGPTAGKFTVAGTLVTSGVLAAHLPVEVHRNGALVWSGALKLVKRYKDFVPAVHTGQECGLVFDNWNDVMKGDEVTQ